MTTIRRFAAALGATAAFVVFSSAPVQAADQCRAACNKSYTQCSGGKNADACLPVWGQCKAKCKRTTTAIKAPAGTAVKQTPVKTASR
jgi:hypothetical protein